MTPQLGQLKKVDIRSQWQNEAADFTPWLASDEGIVMLSDTLGIELEVEDIEVAVGPYSADILARDTATGGYVVIENQLEKLRQRGKPQRRLPQELPRPPAGTPDAGQRRAHDGELAEWLSRVSRRTLSYESGRGLPLLSQMMP